MKILIVTDGFYPEISARSLRATELAKEFAKQGHDVQVIAKDREFDIRSFEHENDLKYNSFGKLRWKDIELKGGKYQLLFRRAMRRLLIMLIDYPSIEIMWRLKQKLKGRCDYDLLISIAAPHSINWGVAWAKNKDNIIAKKWIADCGDPYMGDRTDSFRKLFYFKYPEKWFCRKADYISVPLDTAKDAYYPEFRDKIVVIPQGFCFSNLKRATYKKNRNYPHFAFAGSLTMYIHSAPSFFKYLLTIKSEFLFILYTETLGWAEEDIQKLGKKSKVMKFIEREQLIFELSKMDFLVNFMYKTNVQRSSKLINYALSGRPIMNIEVGTDLKLIVSEFLAGNYRHQLIVNNIEDFNINKVAKQFTDLSLA